MTLTGQRLAGVSQVRVSGGALSRARSCCRSPRRPAVRLTVQMPTDPPLPAGVVAVTAQVTVADGNTLASNAVPLVLVPVITSTAPLAATLSGGSATIEVSCSPPVLASQTVALVLGAQIVAGTAGRPRSEPRTSLSFTLQGFTAGSYVLRLRVDGQDSIPVVAGRPASTPTSAWCCRDGPRRLGVAQRRLSRRRPRVAPRPPRPSAEPDGPAPGR